ncbi:MAG: DNA repair protein RecO [Rhodospirillales bacterium]|nr:DNA repair protein RecO [Rhodospirillales bacterium]
MDWQDDGIILSVRKHGETSAIVNVLTRAHGRHAGLVRGGGGKRMSGILQPGNKVQARWHARLPEHLGTFTVEPIKAFAASALSDARRLAALTSACALIEAALPERQAHPAILEGLEILLTSLDDDSVWPVIYVKWEIGLLAELGFGLDLAHCAATGTTEDLTYVSPRTGRAVSTAAAQPYKERLLPLPTFLLDSDVDADIASGLQLTGYFFENHVFQHRETEMPAARRRLAERFRP